MALGVSDHEVRHPALLEFLELFAPAVADGRWGAWTSHTGKFLTVLVRTTGNRPRELEEALLCLAAQECRDFEVIVLAHRATDAMVAVIEQQVATFRDLSGIPARIERVAEGYRGAPLQAGAEAARSRYAAILDDDDYVTAEWVSTFHELESLGPGRVLRVSAAVRTMDHVQGATEATRTCVSATEVEYDESWSVLQHLVINRTPIHAFAFPLYPLRELGVRFRTDIPVVEDWDFLMRVAILCGVSDSPRPTAVYNRHPVNTSEQHVPMTQWRDAEALVRESLQRPLLLETSEFSDRVDTTEVEARYEPKTLRTRIRRGRELLVTGGPTAVVGVVRVKVQRRRSRRG